MSTSSHAAMDREPLELLLGDSSQLFSPPAIKPLSSSPAEALGVSGAEYLLGILYMNGRRQKAGTLLIYLPANLAPSGDAQQVTEALHRYARLRIQAQEQELHNTYRYGWRVVGVAMIILIVCLALSSLFISDMTAWMRPLTRQSFEYGFEIVGWVALWNPIDALLFSPLPIRYRLRALRALGALQVVIKATS